MGEDVFLRDFQDGDAGKRLEETARDHGVFHRQDSRRPEKSVAPSR